MSNNFLDQFQTSMNNLNIVKDKIQAGVAMRQQFTNNVKDSLGKINTRIRDLAGQITNLKKTADELQLKVNENTKSIGDKEKQLAALTQQISQSQQERDAAIRQATEDKQQLQSQIASNQQKIDDCENKLRLITQEKTALHQELQQKGDIATQHSNTIEKLTQDAVTLSQQKDAEFQQKEQALLAKIAECDTKINQFQQQLSDKNAEIETIKQTHDSAQGTSRTQLETLQADIDKLKLDNGNLIDRIGQATNAINEAVNTLNIVSDELSNETSQKDVYELLSQIETSLQNISSVIQGRSIQPSTNQSKLPNNTIITVQGTAKSLDTWKNLITTKIDQLKSNNPKYVPTYQTILNNINNASNPQEVTNLINSIAKNGAIYGGRRTKKHRKQKGGFTYKPSSKRRSISSTHIVNRRFSKKTGRKSSR